MTARKTLAFPLSAILVASFVMATALVAGRSPASAQTPQQYFFYKLGPHDLDEAAAVTVGKFFDLLPAVQSPPSSFVAFPANPCLTFSDANGNVRMIYFVNTGQFKLFTDFTQSFGTPPTPEAAQQDAINFFAQHDLLPAVQDINGSFPVSEVETLANQSWQASVVGAANTGGPVGPPANLLETVNFNLQLDGLRVVGPDYQLSADVSSNGVTGFTHRFRTLLKQTAQFQMITQQQADIKFNEEFAPILKQARAGDPKTTFKVVNSDLVYYEQSEVFLQPAYRFQVVLTSSNGTQIGETLLIPAASKTPEPIKNVPIGTFGANPAFPPGSVTAASSQFKNGPIAPVHLASSVAPPGSKGKVYDPIDFGVYVVRDDNRFLDDANGFISNLEFSNMVADGFLGKGYPQTVLNQYYWDYPWLWENDPADGVPDNSPFFVGENNLVLYEGHGAPWLGTTYSNCCDLINYTTIPGYGAFHGGESTNYVLWHTCDSVPAPGDPYGGDYASPAGPFDVWFNVFQGMRGTYGSRTTVNIYDNVGPNFAAAAGLGVPNLSAWMNAEANDATGHGGGWDYACCVIVAGHENDCIYDTGAVSPPGTLTMYWQY